MIPFNSRLLVEEIKEEEQKVGEIFIPQFTKERKDVPKYLTVKVLAVANNLEDNFSWMIGKTIIIETGLLDEVKIQNKIYKFALINYVVCVID